MTIETWKQEFYPIEATDCPKDDAIAHSLRKWQGLRREALQRHGVSVSKATGSVQDASGSLVRINASTCALCEIYYGEEFGNGCATCPLAISRAGIACDRGDGAPWHEWDDERDPEPMIAALEDAARSQQ